MKIQSKEAAMLDDETKRKVKSAARDNLLGGHLVFDLKTSIQVSCIECGQCVQHPRCRATGHVDSGGGILRLTSCSQFSARNKDAML
mmetsp:Transcript_5657/g.10804  ORF Transcript_5657/g.10804 Transcript_5657/m.10804 type:complete len:87 (-) Transcript_5657:10-270(-)